MSLNRNIFKKTVTVLLVIAAFCITIEKSWGVQAPGDRLLEIPFVADQGNTWASSCIAMLVSYYQKEVSLKDIVEHLGQPSREKYMAVDKMLLEKFALRLTFRHEGTVAGITASIDGKNPIMVLLHDPARGSSCFNVLVVGYNSGTREILLKDPSQKGTVYRKPFEQFEEQWNQATRVCTGWPRRPFFTVDPSRYPGDNVVSVPFEENRGQTCASSSMTMMLRYYGAPVTFEDVLKRAGMPPVINYEAVKSWISKDYSLNMIRYDRRTVDDIVLCLKSGHPVMALQQISFQDVVGHNRVVVGYNLTRKELILNDPSKSRGIEYRMPIADFERLWDLLPKSCPGWPPRPMWIMIPEGKQSPLS